MTTVIDGSTGITPAVPVSTANGGTGLSTPGNANNVLTSDGTNWISAPRPLFNSLITPAVLSAGVQNLAHSLGRKPNFIIVSLIVVVSVNGWAINDEIYWHTSVSGVAENLLFVGCDSTNILVAFASTTLAIPIKTTGQPIAVAASNFKVRVTFL